MTNQKWMLPMAGLLGTLAALIAVLVALGGTGEGSGDGAPAAQERCAAGAEGCDDTVGDGALGICIEGTIDCADTITNPDDAVSDCPPDVVCSDTGVSPEEPVVSDPGAGEPPNSGDLVDPNECSAVHNINACEAAATNLALDYLAARLNVKVEAIAVVSAEFVQWPDSCLGVTTDGVFCAEVITPGFKIVLEHAGIDYEYHTDTADNLAFVE